MKITQIPRYPWMLRHWEFVFGFILGVVVMNLMAYVLTQSLLVLLMMILTIPGGTLLMAGMAAPVARRRVLELFGQSAVE